MALAPRRPSALDVDPFAPPEEQAENPGDTSDDLKPEQEQEVPAPPVPPKTAPVAPQTPRKPRSGSKARTSSSKRQSALPEPGATQQVDWNIHARTIRSGLMAWVASRDKVEQRAEDVRELIRSAGTAVTGADLEAIVRLVAMNTGVPATEVAEAAGFVVEHQSDS